MGRGGVKSVIRITMIITVSSLLRMLAIRFIRRVLWDCLSMERLGLRPGLSLKATEHISFVTKVGFLGYSDSYNGTSDFGGVNFDTENISIGFHYNF